MSRPAAAAFAKLAVQQSFDLASANYNQFTSLQRTIGDSLLEKRPDADHVDVLDIGSGTGYLTKQLCQIGDVENIYALDFSQGMLRETRQSMLGEPLSGLLCCDAESLPLKHKSLSAIYSNVTFQWCLNLPQVFNEVSCALKQNGLFAFSTFGPQTLCELKASWAKADRAVHVNTFVEPETIERDMKLAGFKDINVTSETILMYYDTPKQLMLDLKGMGAHNLNQGRNLGLTGVRAYKSILNAYELLRTWQGIPATFQAVYVYARK
ncbi:MAG: malonyl-[acyl-carrier protein] O-methyltransferase BioC [Cycloclasticus sp. symbiont of Poecilosclerida sp. N]|nr:MAG: malonyl-[acyl-carrier protein] O-methyltransferase BioC [Cycloclasticus sp. symbiont of Poecilosclerida sp. N]